MARGLRMVSCLIKTHPAYFPARKSTCVAAALTISFLLVGVAGNCDGKKE